MNLEITYSLFKKLEKDNISFIYQGLFSNQVLTNATSLIKSDMEGNKGFTSGLKNKLSFLMVENFQNIVRYADVDEEHRLMGDEMFMTRNREDSFYISSANLIENARVEEISERLSKINELNEDDLKALYKSILTNKKMSNEGGAGLGFIEMARKTKEKIDFDFVKINDKYSFFYIQLKLRNSEEENPTPRAYDMKMDDIKKIHGLLMLNNVLLVHRGNFTQEAVKPVLVMVEENMHALKVSVQKKLYHLLVELLQNISKHGSVVDGQTEGIFILSKEGQSYILSVGNFIETSKAENLENYLNELTSKSRDELSQMYKTKLGRYDNDDGKSAGLGLIDIAREVPEPMEYSFYEVNEQLTFFTLICKF